MSRIMRIASVLTLFTVFALLALPSSPASASGMPTRTPVPDSYNTLTLAAGQACAFPVHAEPVVNSEVFTTFPPEANGDVVTQITGYLLERVANLATGKSVVVNISGPETVVLHSDGSITLIAYGPSVLILFPTDSPPGPTFVINYGRYVANFTLSGQETLVSQSGTQFDVCAALS